jgi:hypothetical protein
VLRASVLLKGLKNFAKKGHLGHFFKGHIFTTPILVHIWTDLKGQLMD